MEKTSPVTWILPFMEPISEAQSDSAGISLATGLPCLVKALLLEFRRADLNHHVSIAETSDQSIYLSRTPGS